MNSQPSDEATKEVDLDMIEMLAAGWLSRRDRGLTPEEAVEFARWRAADPRHEAAVGELGAMWTALDDMSALQGKSAGPAAGATRQPRRPRVWVAWTLAAAAAVAVATTLVLRQERAPEPIAAVRYETAVGAQRDITLSDGSSLRLNTDSAVEVRYAVQERRIVLSRGEARFSVMKDAARPFIVAVDGVEARALGTSFIVQRRSTDTELVVTEGRVKFGTVAGAAAEVGAGQTALCEPRAASAPRVETLDQAALARRVAWESGLLICRPGMTVAEAAVEFNRYHRQKIVLPEGEVRGQSMAGGFKVAELEVFVWSLEQNFGLTVAERDAEHVTLKLKR
jgi:transmembrane sensor